MVAARRLARLQEVLMVLSMIHVPTTTPAGSRGRMLGLGCP